MADADFSTVGYIAKQTYTDERRVFNAASRDRVLLTKVAKKKFAKGSSFRPAIIFANNQGLSHTYSSIDGNQSPTQGTQWDIQTAESHGKMTINAKLMHETAGQGAAYVEAIENEIDSNLDNFGAWLGRELYGDGLSIMGVMTNAAFATTTMTLAVAATARNFGKGQIIQLVNPGVGTRAGTLTVAAINDSPGVGTITTTANISTGVAAAAQNDQVVNNGDYNLGGKGLAAWVPLTSPSATAFFGVDRTQDVVSLAGNRLNQSALGYEDIIITLGAMIFQAGGKPDWGFMNPLRWADMAKTQQARIMIEETSKQSGDATSEIGFQYLSAATPAGPCKIYPDPSLTDDLLYLCESKSMGVIYAGPGFPHINRDDGLWARKATGPNVKDAVEVHTRAYWQFWLKCPSHFGVAALPT